MLRHTGRAGVCVTGLWHHVLSSTRLAIMLWWRVITPSVSGLSSSSTSLLTQTPVIPRTPATINCVIIKNKFSNSPLTSDTPVDSSVFHFSLPSYLPFLLKLYLGKVRGCRCGSPWMLRYSSCHRVRAKDYHSCVYVWGIHLYNSLSMRSMQSKSPTDHPLWKAH